MISRRKFIITSSLAASGALTRQGGLLAKPSSGPAGEPSYPVVISTWSFGKEANMKAWDTMTAGGSSLDAVERGVNVIEADPDNLSVGIGGLPDRDGIVTLDACIMDHAGHAGSVTFLQDIVHPISVARLVMEKTPHVMLSGEGALHFALENGFKKQNLLTEKAKKAWEAWKIDSKYQPVINFENHDTIGLLAIDKSGGISGGCSTSGLSYKMHGRVGDSPIIGAGLFVDSEVGAAVATGLGELVMKTLSAFLVVELMRNGKTPREACEEAIQRIIRKIPEYKDFQVGLIALDKAGNPGAFAIQKGFSYALSHDDKHEVFACPSFL